MKAQTAMQQTNDLKVFVSPLEGQDADVLGKSIRTKLISSLEKHGVSITESKENAGAFLAGSSLVQTTKKWKIEGHTSYCIRATMKLVSKDGAALWESDVSSDRIAVSETSNFVEKVTQGVVKTLFKMAQNQ